MEHTKKSHTGGSGFLPFDPIVLIHDVLKRWLLILLAALVVGIGTYIAADIRYAPVYRTTTTYVVTTRSSSSTVYTNLSSTSSLAAVFSDLLNSSIMRKAIVQEIDAQSFDGTINAAVVPETNLVTVTVTAPDPRTAFQVAQAIMEHHESVTYQVVGGISLEVLQHPVVPTAPINYANAAAMMKKTMVLAAAAAALLLGCASFFRDVVRSGSEARNKLDCSYLGDVPHENKYKTLAAWIAHRKTSILITDPATSFRFVESLRKLRRRVERLMRSGKVLMVTSLLENEGKSTVAVNLALAMARKHEKVLLIDCDLRKPACHYLMQQKNIRHGLKDVLLEGVSLAEAILCDKKSNLFMLLEPKGHRNSGDLIASENMQTLLQWARREFDFVVLDLPPMAEVSDAESMMEFADASLLVVRQNTAVTASLNKAVATLDSGRAKLLGCVLNNVHSSGLTSGYGYGYGYGYGKHRYYGYYGSKDSGSAE